MREEYTKDPHKGKVHTSKTPEKTHVEMRGRKDQPERRERQHTTAARSTQDNSARQFSYSRFDSETDNLPKRYKASWGTFVSRLSRFDVRESKLGGEAFSPAVFKDKRRSKANVIELSMLVLDYDHDITIDEAREIWDAQRCAYALYTSHSHQRETDKHPTPEDCFRVVIPLRKPIPAEDFPLLWEWAKRLSEEKLDPACKDASRIYFFSAIYSEDSPHEFHEEKGEFLNWRPIVEDERGRQETEGEKTKREATPRSNASAVASVKLTLDDITYDKSSPLEVWKAELGVKISADSTAKLNPEGNIDCRGYCHRGTNVTGLFFNPQINGVTCNKGCDLKRIGQAFDMSKMPHRQGAQTEHVITPRTDFSHEGVLKDILANLPTGVDFREEAGVPEDKNVTRAHLYVITVDKVIEVAKALGCGLAKHLDFVYQFNGQYWKQIEKDELTHFLGDAAERLGVIRTTARDHLFRDALLRQFLSTAYLPPPTLRDGITLINLSNGTFEINADKREMRDFRREDFLTYQLPFTYDQNAQAPMWTKFLSEVLPDQSLQDICSEFMGYCFTNGLKLEKVMLLYGSGANGKSVFFEVMNALFGDENISHYGLAHLSHEYNRAKIANKLLNYSSELAGKYATDIFKQLASGEPIQARLPYGHPFEIRKYAKLAFNANELPIVVEHNKAFFRRFLIVPFDVTIPEEHQDKDLASKIIAAELPGIFNWVVAGLERLLEQRKFSRCEAVEKANDAYKRDSDSVAMFVEELWETDASAKTPLKDLYRDYRDYCQDNGYSELGRKNFTKRLDSLGVSKTLIKKQPHYHLIRSDADDERVPFNENDADTRRHLRVVRSK